MKTRNLLLLLFITAFGALSGQNLAPPIDFESTTINYTWTDFDGGQATVISNPQVGGMNTSATVGQMVKNTGQPWGGSLIQMTNPFDFSVNKIFTMKVYSPRVGARVLLKVEDPNNGAIFFEKEDTSSVANAWETLTFDFSAINTSNTYQNLVLIWDLGTVGDGSPNFTFLFDDIELSPSSGPTLAQVDLPITFDDTMVDYTTTDFGGNASFVVVDPTDPNNMVCQVNKDSTAQLWAGTTTSTANGLATAIPFSATATVMSVRVWSPDAGIPVRLKVEDKTDPTRSCETEAITTVAGQWETLQFDFNNEAPGTAALDLSYTFDMASIFFNFGTDGATAGFKTYFFDDVYFGVPVTLDQIDLPITFEDPNVDYTLTDFGGNFHAIVTDPTDPNNTVAEVNKDSTAQLWAGTTISTPAGLANAIPFAMGATEISVRVWSPDAGIPVRVKAEDHTNPTISVETETNTTVAGAWETLVFDFSNEVSGTAAIDFANTYDMLSIFFNFGTDGATAGFKTYYFDDVMFGVMISVDRPQLEGLRFFPNPATDRMVVEADQDISNVVVYDMTGREVLRAQGDSYQVQLDLNTLESGVYMVTVQSEIAESHFRMVKR